LNKRSKVALFPPARAGVAGVFNEAPYFLKEYLPSFYFSVQLNNSKEKEKLYANKVARAQRSP